MVVRNQQEPVFVNLQKTRVQVLDRSGRPVYVEPYQKKLNGDIPPEGAVYEVRGEHYAQFVSSAGPLYPHPDPSPVAKPAPKPTPSILPAAPTVLGTTSVHAGFEAAVAEAPVEVAKLREEAAPVEAKEEPAKEDTSPVLTDVGEGTKKDAPVDKPKAKRKVAAKKSVKKTAKRKTARRKTTKRKTASKSKRKN